MKFANVLVYGVVNVVLSVPALYGYSSVIFAHQAFKPWSPMLAKMVVLSSAVHQTVFCLQSKMPWAIGQVQDAGLIFLSKIASKVAEDVLAQGGTPAEATMTTIVSLSISTALLGGALVCFGRARLTYFVSYLPMSVLSGYLAFIGFFCIEAGLGLCVNQAINGPSTWHLLWNPGFNLILAAPGLLGGALLCIVSRRAAANNDAALPLAIVGLLLIFYLLVLIIPNYTVAQARSDGWLAASHSKGNLPEFTSPTEALWHQEIWLLTGLRAAARTLPAMVAVVAFSSCLDVAAIEVDLGRPLDMDSELAMVGLSNVVAGLCGGFTGSYIFSQTIFSFRVGVRNRFVGALVAVAEIAIVLIHADLLALLPSFWFASTLAFVGIDLLFEWLVEARVKFGNPLEYIASLGTFVAIHLVGLDAGLLVGLLLAVFVFLQNAASSGVTHGNENSSQPLTRIEPVSLRSLNREPKEERMLSRMRHKLVVLELRGLLWWGTAASMYAQIRAALRLDGLITTGSSDQGHHFLSDTTQPATHTQNFSPLRRTASLHTERSSLLSSPHKVNGPNQHKPMLRSASLTTERRGWVAVLDLRRVDGLDASAVRSLFVPLLQLARMADVGLAFVHLQHTDARLLAAHGAPVPDGEAVRAFDTLDDALEWAQQRQLALGSRSLEPRVGPRSYGADHTTIRLQHSASLEESVPPLISSSLPTGNNYIASKMPRTQLEGIRDHELSLGAARFLVKHVLLLGDDDNDESAITALRTFCANETHVKAGDIVFAAGDDADSFFCCLTGELCLNHPHLDLESGKPNTAATKELAIVKPGTFFGFVDFLVQRSASPTKRTFFAQAHTHASFAVFYFADLDLLFRQYPTLGFSLQRALLRQTAIELHNA